MKQTIIKNKYDAAIFGILVIFICLTVYSVIGYFQFTVQIQLGDHLLQQKRLTDATVQEILHEEGIDLIPEDVCVPRADTILSSDATITVVQAVAVEVVADGVSHDLRTVPVSQLRAVQLAGIAMSDKDFIEHETIYPVTEGQSIHVVRVTEKFEQQPREIPYTTKQEHDANLEMGLSKVRQQGVVGRAIDTIVTTYYDGVEANRHVASTEILKEMKPHIVAEGMATNVSRGGRNISFTRAYEMQATGYTYSGYLTATGHEPRVGFIAVDPNVIPLGSKVYVDGYGFATAADTGGAIKGNRIDLFFETEEECFDWGNRSAKVFLLK